MKKTVWKKMLGMAMAVSLLLITATGCGQTPSATTGASGGGKELIPVTQVTNWFAQPEHGGQYAAQMKDFYKEAGMDMTILPGGPKVSATQIVASGKAQFGMSQSDELLMARKEGLPLVAIAGIFQVSPQGFVYHKGQPIKTFSDFNGRQVWVTPGAGNWEYIKKEFKLDSVKEMAHNGSMTNFVADPTSVTQCYVTNEPFALEQQGVEVETMLVADSGYSPYVNVLFTTEKLIKENPELVKAYVEASIKGWNYYKDHSGEVNQFLQKSNPDLQLDAMDFTAKTQKDFVYGGDAEKHGVGYMDKGRWEQLMKILVNLKLLDKELDVNEAFTNEFLPKG
ncbi:ABC transporter substrate-binding protein [Brevibacillus sp. B_LB10_24]|uniref:ABC transporter substrate-binding protein n=1 Tax=Brevibacillus sp. B_LB10_24 TaxID=3380645 RepID=UPI0038B6DB8D